ncbi:MAG: hypothetical protein LBI92_00360 [Azoarcus sp.]|nr:hypothetical protein [Azoarcus sp.]
MKKSTKLLIFLLAVPLVLALLLAVFLMIAPAREDFCFVADQNYEVKVERIDQSTYYLYLQISGFHEKETFLAVYDEKPVFDRCGLSKQHSIGATNIASTEAEVDTKIKSPIKIILFPNKKVAEIHFKDTDDGDDILSQLTKAVINRDNAQEDRSRSEEEYLRARQEFASGVKIVIRDDLGEDDKTEDNQAGDGQVEK